MSSGPPPNGDTPPRREDFARSADQVARQRSLLHQDTSRLRRVLRPGDIARRQRLVRWAKWALPAAALLLLGSIALWPALDRLINMQRGALREMENLHVTSGNMLGAVYRGLDEHDRPFMITADQAQQISQDRINLTRPAADTLTQGGDWMMVSAVQGVYLQHEQLLDLTQDVALYREDGVILTGVTADMDLRQGIIASDQWVHAEGPFGMLDAQGVLLSQHEGIAQFRGPGRLILNDDAHAGPAGHPSAPHASQTEPSR
ncbi:LPS export ABC transporter periplasmic protein LptC [Gluconacetobacter tumulicola]|uniref:LPS export ABC transporter periplasmic protein LptC n=1 Tax=Gluconacetobacter tumulicola TaxID=1017177 RepID=A0A7W4P809_9PROT|nr:LPS export ABC transporter periplasmic protein LptC [Gluconacetobacter tumulicola]MBB2178903.1 LPS export ABC transporter periplasmic protein LptC [Gluconacetobacter tumulicola]